jgi:hypothetical protein
MRGDLRSYHAFCLDNKPKGQHDPLEAWLFWERKPLTQRTKLVSEEAVSSQGDLWEA